MNDTRSTVEKLKELSEQLKNGKISQEEFNVKKQEILHPSSATNVSIGNVETAKSTKKQQITLACIAIVFVIILASLYPLYNLLPAHTQIKILEGYYSRQGKQIIYSQTESHETAILIYIDGSTIYYYDHSGVHEITPCDIKEADELTPHWTHSSNGLNHVDVASKKEPVNLTIDCSSCDFQYIQNHCLLGRSKKFRRVAYIIKFGGEYTRIYVAPDLKIDERDKDGILRFCAVGHLELDSISEKRGWKRNSDIYLPNYSEYVAHVFYDTESDTMGVYGGVASDGLWFFSGNVLNDEDVEKIIYSSIERNVNWRKVKSPTPAQQRIQKFYDDLSQSCKRGHEEDFAHWVEHQWDICTPRFREAVRERAQEANIFVCSQDPGDFYTRVSKYDQEENAYEVECFYTSNQKPYAHLIWIMDSGEYGCMALDNIFYEGVSSHFCSGGFIANY